MQAPQGKQWGPNSIRLTLWKKQKAKCCYCGVQMWSVKQPKQWRGKPSNQATIEHLNAKKDGGKNQRENVALACIACNRQRDHLEMNWLEFATYKQGGLTALTEQE
jgi:5-methylcytosine-specific restriction endonuclease McrA